MGKEGVVNDRICASTTAACDDNPPDTVHQLSVRNRRRARPALEANRFVAIAEAHICELVARNIVQPDGWIGVATRLQRLSAHGFPNRIIVDGGTYNRSVAG